MTVNVSNEEIVIAAGATEPRDLPGAQLICYASTDEALVSMDGRGWLPFSRGIELNAPSGVFSKLYFKNPTGNPITLEVAVVSEARVFVDRRELAASIAVDGGIVTNTAPLTDQGGSIRQYSNSAFNANIDATGAQQQADIITAEANVNGVRIRHALVEVLVASGIAYTWLDVSVPQHMYLVAKDGSRMLPHELEIPAGLPVRYTVQAGMRVIMSVHYDLL